MTPFGWLFVAMAKGNFELSQARREFQRTVNPEELRAWVFEQLKKHPVEGPTDSSEEWPLTFPRFKGRTPRVYVYTWCKDHRGKETRGASMHWDFFDRTLSVVVYLNLDGTPADIDDESTWAKGVRFG